MTMKLHSTVCCGLTTGSSGRSAARPAAEAEVVRERVTPNYRLKLAVRGETPVESWLRGRAAAWPGSWSHHG
jgi:hypothetical protein